MAFIELPYTPRRPGLGPSRADIMIVGDHSRSIDNGKTVLEKCLHSAGLTIAECHLTSLLTDYTKIDSFVKLKPKFKVTVFPSEHMEALDNTIESVQPKVIVAAGKLITYCLTGKSPLTAFRGYPFLYNDRIVVPVLEPEEMIWSNYIWRHYLSHDLQKVKRYAREGWKNPNLDISYSHTFGELCELLRQLQTIDRTSVDIEVSNFEVSCIGFTTGIDRAISIAFDDRWTEEEETEIWRLVAAILENPHIVKIGQNFIFDIYFLMYRMGIFIHGYIQDSMMAHSIMYPEFLKGLGFLGSVYTDLPYWKDMVSFKNIKKEA